MEIIRANVRFVGDLGSAYDLVRLVTGCDDTNVSRTFEKIKTIAKGHFKRTLRLKKIVFEGSTKPSPAATAVQLFKMAVIAPGRAADTWKAANLRFQVPPATELLDFGVFKISDDPNHQDTAGINAFVGEYWSSNKPVYHAEEIKRTDLYDPYAFPPTFPALFLGKIVSKIVENVLSGGDIMKMSGEEDLAETQLTLVRGRDSKGRRVVLCVDGPGRASLHQAASRALISSIVGSIVRYLRFYDRTEVRVNGREAAPGIIGGPESTAVYPLPRAEAEDVELWCERYRRNGPRDGDKRAPRTPAVGACIDAVCAVLADDPTASESVFFKILQKKKKTTAF